MDAQVYWVRAGHDPAIFYDPESDAFEELRGAGIALGVDIDGYYAQNQKTDLKKGQIILLGSDGLWEARNSKGDMFGKEPLYRLLKEHKDKSSSQIVEEILARTPVPVSDGSPAASSE